MIKKSVLIITLCLIPLLARAEVKSALPLDTPEHADEVLNTPGYINKSLDVYLEDYDAAKEPIVSRLKERYKKQGKNVSAEEISQYTVSYLSAFPKGSTNEMETCIFFPTLVPGFRHITNMSLCVIPKKNTLEALIKNRSDISKAAINAFLENRNLTDTQKNKLLLLKQRVKYFGITSPSEEMAAKADCTQFTVAHFQGGSAKTFYICLDAP